MGIFTSTEALGVTKEQIMCNTGTLGIPEFGTSFTIKLVEDTKPTTFGELIKTRLQPFNSGRSTPSKFIVPSKKNVT